MLTVQDAAKILQTGGVVAFPTETVYGLGACISLPNAIEKIFSTKERPYFDPLIVHISEISQIGQIALSFPLPLKVLAEKFWPGPLTLVLPRRNEINPLICSGLDTIGIRIPRHPMAIELLKLVGPLAAPSANRFKKTSPSKAQHVIEEFEGRVPVLDGGDCEVGIESTVIGFNDNKVEVYRLGTITPNDIKKVLQDSNLEIEIVVVGNKAAPGQLEDHYMPNKPLYILENSSQKNQLGLNFLELKLTNDPILAARTLYAQMRELAKVADGIYFVKENIDLTDQRWNAVLDRLVKASVKN